MAKATPSKSAKSSGKASAAKVEVRGRGRPPMTGERQEASTVIKKANKYPYAKEENLKTYIYKLLKQVHPEIGISKDAMVVVNKMVLELYKKLAKNASELSRSNKQKSLVAKDVQAAIKLTIPGELQRHCITEVARAVAKFSSHQ